MSATLFDTISEICTSEACEVYTFEPGDIVVDHENNPYLFFITEGYYIVEFLSPFDTMHEVGDIEAPNIIGESIFFEQYHKPVKVTAKTPGKLYKLHAQKIQEINEKHPGFREKLMQASLISTNTRLREANLERTLDYALSDYFEKHINEGVVPCLKLLKKTFHLKDVIWIERHKILKDVYAIKYIASNGDEPINERIDIEKELTENLHSMETFPYGIPYTSLFPIESLGTTYGYIGLVHSAKNMSTYIERIMYRLQPIFIRMIETFWERN